MWALACLEQMSPDTTLASKNSPLICTDLLMAKGGRVRTRTPGSHIHRDFAATAGPSPLSQQALSSKVRGRAGFLSACPPCAALGEGNLQERQALLRPLWSSIKPPGEGQQTLLPSEHLLQLEEENRKKSLLPRKRQKCTLDPDCETPPTAALVLSHRVFESSLGGPGHSACLRLRPGQQNPLPRPTREEAGKGQVTSHRVCCWEKGKSVERCLP